VAQVTPEHAFRLAIAEGKRGTGFVSPNPLVGCVIVGSDGSLLATGYHALVGHHHAEIDALKNIKDQNSLKGATMYVTLEPCAHEGRTGSCAKALAKLPLKRVVYGLQDPYPLVSGKGAEIVRAAGIECIELKDFAELSSETREQLIGELEDLAENFLHNVRAGEPFVAVKVATSLDGIMALDSGESKWMTGEASRAYVHELRAGYDAVLVGRNTIANDNPKLNVRLPSFEGKQNKVVVLDPGAKSLGDLAATELLKVRSPENIFVVVREGLEVANPSGVKILSVRTDVSGSFDIPSLLKELMAHDIRSVFVEGGSQTFSAFFKSGRVQRVHLFLAPHLIGGAHGLSWSRHFGVSKMNERLELKRVQQRSFAPDIYVTGRL
jgi:diaminohydroxyphosphoribosylaminopyrimidine deaminase / 5-amino-6-(5-phosphoribosylamino)uracil reductase